MIVSLFEPMIVSFTWYYDSKLYFNSWLYALFEPMIVSFIWTHDCELYLNFI